MERTLASADLIDTLSLPTAAQPAPTVEEQWVVYEPNGAMRSPLKILSASLSDLWSSRELAWILFTRDLRSQVRQSLLGYAWLLAGPITTAVIWVFLHAQKVVRFDTEIPYPLFVLSGTVIWGMLRAGFDATFGIFGNDILKKLNVPIEAFLVKNFANVVFQFLLAMIPLTCLMAVYRVVPPTSVLLFPLGVAGLVLVGAAAGCFVAPLASLYGDVGRIVGIAFTGLMYLSPVIYPVPAGGTLSLLMSCNPLVPIITLCRDLFFGRPAQAIGPAVWTVGLAAAVMLAGLVFLRIARPHIIARQGM